MKTIIHKDKVLRLYTIRDVADAIGVGRVTFWRRVKGVNSTLPQPTFKHGLREYYTEAVYKRLVALHLEAQAEVV